VVEAAKVRKGKEWVLGVRKFLLDEQEFFMAASLCHFNPGLSGLTCTAYHWGTFINGNIGIPIMNTFTPFFLIDKKQNTR
jgi:hypothetical protein